MDEHSGVCDFCNNFKDRDDDQFGYCKIQGVRVDAGDYCNKFENIKEESDELS